MVDQKDLPSISAHSMTCKTVHEEAHLIGSAFEHLIQFYDRVEPILETWIMQEHNIFMFRPKF